MHMQLPPFNRYTYRYKVIEHDGSYHVVDTKEQRVVSTYDDYVVANMDRDSRNGTT